MTESKRTKRISVTITEHVQSVLDKMALKYPHLESESLLLVQALQEWEWRQESGDSRGANIRRTLSEIQDIKDIALRVDARIARMEVPDGVGTE